MFLRHGFNVGRGLQFRLRFSGFAHGSILWGGTINGRGPFRDGGWDGGLWYARPITAGSLVAPDDFQRDCCHHNHNQQESFHQRIVLSHSLKPPFIKDKLKKRSFCDPVRG